MSVTFFWASLIGFPVINKLVTPEQSGCFALGLQPDIEVTNGRTLADGHEVFIDSRQHWCIRCFEHTTV